MGNLKHGGNYVNTIFIRIGKITCERNRFLFIFRKWGTGYKNTKF